MASTTARTVITEQHVLPDGSLRLVTRTTVECETVLAAKDWSLANAKGKRKMRSPLVIRGLIKAALKGAK